ncbi:MAG: hypothetical protein HOV79_07320 [Hamadaea sp.]|nr:hypothetical protein [Hamadaea sp.]
MARHDLRRRPPAPRPHRPEADAPAAARPVFVDRSGRRRRFFTFVGGGLGVLLVIGLIVVASSLFAGGPAQLPGWPGAGGAADVPPSTAVHSPDPVPTVASPRVTTAAASPTPKKGQANTHRPTAKPSNTRRP